MSQSLRILGKDIRRLWAPLLIALAVQALFVFFEMQPHQGGAVAGLSAEGLVDILLPVAWWYLVIALVHGESLVGERQFWVTRPYRWKSLLAARAIFVALFVNVAVLVADCLILRAQGFSVAAHWQGMLWKQIPFTIAILLPALALASVTRSLSQVIVVVLLIVLRIVVDSLRSGGLPGGSTAVDWIGNDFETLVVMVVFSSMVLIQYRARRTWLARGIFAAFVIVPGVSLPLRWELGFQAFVKPAAIDTRPIRLSFDHTRGRRAPLMRTPVGNSASVALPISVNGVPDAVRLVSERARLNIATDTFDEAATLERDKRGYWETILLPVEVFNAARAKLVSLRVRPVVTAVRETEFRAPLETGPVRVPFVGICESGQPFAQYLAVTCRWALAAPLRTRVHADYPGWDAAGATRRPNEGIVGRLSDSVFPADLGLSPVHTEQAFGLAREEFSAATASAGTQLVFRTEHPLAHFETEIEMGSVRLEDYVVSEPDK